MRMKIRILRIALVASGLQTMAGSVMGIYGSVTQLQAWLVDPLSVIVGFSLSILLGVGGSCLVVRGIKYNGHPA